MYILFGLISLVTVHVHVQCTLNTVQYIDNKRKDTIQTLFISNFSTNECTDVHNPHPALLKTH